MNNRCVCLGCMALLGMLLGGWAGSAAARNTASETVPTPKLIIERPLLDLGNVQEGDPLSACFVLRNAGKGTLHIRKVISSRDGIRADHPEQVPPGSVAQVCLNIATLGTHGRHKFKTALYTDDPALATATLTVRADIEPLVTLTPDRIFFDGTREDPGRLAREIRIRNRGPNPVRVTLQSNGLADKVKAELTCVEKGKTYRLEVQNIAAVPDTYRGRLLLHTDHPGRERIAVPVFGRLPAPVAVYPEKLVLASTRCPQCRVRATCTGQVLLRAHDGKALKIISTGPERNDLHIDIEPLATGRDFRIAVRYETGKAPAPASVVIRTDREGFDKIEVPVVVGER